MMKENILKICYRLLRWIVPALVNRHRQKANAMPDKKRIARGVRRFFAQNYELRYNILKQQEEFRPLRPDKQLRDAAEARHDAKGPLLGRKEAPQCAGQCALSATDEGWRQLTDRELWRIAFEQMEQVGVAWSVDVELYVRSSMIPDYDPVGHYLKSLPPWDGQTDYICQLARRVPCALPEWSDWFHRWFLAMVAQWQRRPGDYGNSLVPLLIGGQGTRKSTFCRLLLPPGLREYYIDDIKFVSPEQVERMLARMLLVNIDEYNAKTDREQAKIKRVLTERDVQTRKMRSDQYVLMPRMASFIATTNEREPLCDPTGSRRYLCCEVTGMIDTETPIPYEALYAQACAELDRGASWHLSKAEEAALEQHNQNYQQQPTSEQVLLAWFEPAARQKENFMLATSIQRELARHVRATDLPSLAKLTIALRRCHFPYGRMNGLRGWYAAAR